MSYDVFQMYLQLYVEEDWTAIKISIGRKSMSETRSDDS